MRTATRLATATGVAISAAALFAGPATASASADTVHRHRASTPVFVQTDNVQANTVVAYDRAEDGTLTQAGVYPTGGQGGVLTGSVVDHLASQGSLGYDAANHLLYAVNAGGNTITVFGVEGDRLSRHQVLASGGSFPVSVAVHGNLVYVLNARDGGAVQGFLRIGGGLLGIPSWNRSLGLDATLTPEFTHTPGQVAFTPDGRHLVVTTKANGNNIDVFGVNRFGGLTATPVVNTQPGAVPFAIAFDARGHLVIAEAGASAVATFDIGRDGTLTAIATAATGQAATCWVVSTGSYLYASNAGSASVTGYRSTAGSLTSLGNFATDAGTVDAAVTADARFLYVQAGAAGIVDEFAINPDGSLQAIGSVTVPGAAGGEGIAAD